MTAGGQRYDFLSRWRIDDAPLTAVADVLEDTASLPRWWPELFRDVTIVHAGGEHAQGLIAKCTCRARLPYTLRFTYTVVEQRYPFGSTLDSTGDLVGRGIWRLSARDGGVDAEYEWQVRLEKPWLRFVTPLLRRLLSWNHEWSMRKGEAGLRREVARRSA